MKRTAGGIDAIPHPDNGRRCICGRPVYLTPNGWRDRSGTGSHTPPTRTRQTPDRVGNPTPTGNDLADI